MAILTILFFFACVSTTTFSITIPPIHRLRDPVTLQRAIAKQHQLLGITTPNAPPPPPPYKWTEEYYDHMPIDHFSYADGRKFSLRYFINTDHSIPNGPILFYTGNEGDLEGFAENTGFMWDISAEFNATVVFSEHRFYGKSQPFGNDSYSSVHNLGYLSSTQALADFAQLIGYLKEERIPDAKHSPVIAFGGSYGGMLTAWLRIKYPHVVDGGIAASAPVFWFESAHIPDDIFDRIVARTFRNSGCSSKAVLTSFRAITQLGETDEGRTFLNEQFHLANESQIHNSNDVQDLLNAIQGVMETMAMVDYPYPASFLASLPAWPVKEACKSFSKVKKSQKDSALASYDLLNIFYNTSGTAKSLCVLSSCPGPFSALGDPEGWPWQTCTEMAMPMCSSGPPNDFFTNSCPWNVDSFKKGCASQFSHINYTVELFRPDWVILNYGASFPTATNIVFSNGYLDPWSGGGWGLRPSTQGSLVSLIVEDGAHHYDLRGAHPNDTDSVKEVRRLEKLHIQRWIDEVNQRRREIKAKAKGHHKHRNHRHP